MIKGTMLLWGWVAFSAWVHVRGIKMQTVTADLSAGDGRPGPSEATCSGGGGGGLQWLLCTQGRTHSLGS